jgi:hypothetical protein
LNRFAGEIRNKLCGFTARDLKTNDVLRVVTAKDAAAQLYEMDAVLRERTEARLHFGRNSSADHIFSHMYRAHLSPSSERTSVKSSALFEALHALISQRVPLHNWGACGAGKSQILARWQTALSCVGQELRNDQGCASL